MNLGDLPWQISVMGKRKAATAAGASDDEAAPAEVTVKKEKKAKFEVDDSRTRPLNDVAFEKGGGPVVYWCSRDQRVQDNWALLYAQQEAINRKVPLVVVFNLSPGFLGATLRAYGFMIRGLKEVANDCTKLNIPFVLLRGDCIDTVPTFVRGHNCSLLVSDFSPLRIGREWRTKVAKLILDDGIPHVEVDAHNITPAWICSDKKETGARTIRKKCHNHLAQYLHDFPPVTKHQYTSDSITTTEFEVKEVLESLTEVDRTVPEVKGITPGPAAGLAHLTSFLAKRIKKYAAQRNVPSDPSGVSGLSPWLHYGHLSAQRCILEAQKVRSKANEGVASFIEELYIRRELCEYLLNCHGYLTYQHSTYFLADNFCLYEPNYDSLKGCAGWAQETLEVHAKDKREHLYSTKELEECRTHDDMWNAAQREMMATGKVG